MMFEVNVAKFATVKLDAKDEGDAMVAVMAMDLVGKWAECWDCEELKEESNPLVEE